ncbi:uncharacterized protein LOC113238749, partial [Hyposmocoma kahamanoa]|uniref:uncharacterized protein LOC113238749 n=1 Tax=Hyposmocoma kahamanoa TaxID=1477025 RepID=UPI000E6D8032
MVLNGVVCTDGKNICDSFARHFSGIYGNGVTRDIPNTANIVQAQTTGARIVEVPGATSAEKADTLAAKLEEAIGGLATVTRPTKTADLRVTGFDESVTPEKIRAVVAAKGRCPQSAVSVGAVRLAPNGRGSALVRCPVTAAQRVAAAGRILVGWSSAGVHVMEPLPMRCFRCMGIGHTRALCPSSVDRSGLCFRCGQVGHSASGCTATPRCSVCTAARRPADHVMGGRSCAPSPTKGKSAGTPGPPLLRDKGNPNHCARAQDLLVQAMAEWGVAVAAVAEPYFVPPQRNWAGDREETVAIVASTAGHSPPLVVKERGSGFVAARWGEVILIGVYFSPNRTLAQFQAFLETLERAVRRAAPTPVLVLGDFNAKSAAWGSPVTNTRGPELENWAAVLGLAILNRGHANTCVRRNGGSIVDVTFATPSLAARVSGWQVLEDEETLSDHKYIRMRVSHTPPTAASNTAPGGGFPKWALTRLDLELAEEAAMVQA